MVHFIWYRVKIVSDLNWIWCVKRFTVFKKASKYWFCTCSKASIQTEDNVLHPLWPIQLICISLPFLDLVHSARCSKLMCNSSGFLEKKQHAVGVEISANRMPCSLSCTSNRCFANHRQLDLLRLNHRSFNSNEFLGL